jgi:hypothetical protein
VGAVGQGCAQLVVDEGAVLGGQAGGLAGDEGGAPLREPGGHGGQGVRQLAGERAGEAEESGAAGGGLAAGQGDLGGDAAALLTGGQAQVAVLGAHRVVEVDGELGLDRAGVGLEVFEEADGGDAFGVRQARIGQGGDLGVEVGCGHAAVYRTCVRIARVLDGIGGDFLRSSGVVSRQALRAFLDHRGRWWPEGRQATASAACLVPLSDLSVAT